MGPCRSNRSNSGGRVRWNSALYQLLRTAEILDSAGSSPHADQVNSPDETDLQTITFGDTAAVEEVTNSHTAPWKGRRTAITAR